jgi:glycosyltransferase involved in cell wall biosynthesis
MHSSLPQQMTNFKFTQSGAIIRFFEALERWVIRHANAVITICPDLDNHVRSAYGRESILIENVVDYDTLFGEKDLSASIRSELGLKGKRVALYAGTFEHYQGIDLLIESAERIRAEAENLVWLLVGGHPDQVEHYRTLVRDKGLADVVRFVGQVPPQDVSSYIRCSDVLTSPRTAGTNTPLKIYSYLRSGVPVVATRLWTHTQVLDDAVSILAEPDPELFGRAVLSVLRDSKKAKAVTRNAAELSRLKYGYDTYKLKLARTLRLAKGEA